MLDRVELRGFLSGLAVFVMALLVGGTVWSVIPGQPLLQTLRFHTALVALLIGIGLALTGSRWRAVVVVGLTVASIVQGGLYIYNQQVDRGARALPPGSTELTLTSFNVLETNRAGAAGIAAMLIDAPSDVVFLMEARPMREHLEALAAIYPYRAGCEPDAQCDLMMLSRTPLTGIRVLSLSHFSPQRAILAQTIVDGAPTTLAAVHLTKPYFDDRIEQETGALRRLLTDIDGPIVMAGDFNAAPWSYAIARLVQGAALSVAPSYPATWPTMLGPLGVPIDNAFTRGPAQITAIEAIADPMGSNHRGLQIAVGLAPP
jgi:endonuclease/exonuclease/phosphatase (EEP) superfamily protein YafD